MNVPEGFQQTEVGVIPQDWSVISAADACQKIQDGTHFSPKIGGNDYLYVTSKNIRNGFLDFSTAGRIDKKQHDLIYKRCDVKRGDILFTKDGANTGNAAINILQEEFSLLSSVAFLRVKEIYDTRYFLQQILSSEGQKQIQEAMSGNAITRLTLEKINKLAFPLPPTKAEQTAIAAALSDMDALIEGVEKLLEKKRRIKQGAMQELLRPKEGWKIHKLDELCTPSKKRIDPKISQQVYKCVELEHIGQESGRLLGYAFTDELKSQKTLFNAGDTLFGKLRPYLKKFLFASFDGCCTTEIWALQPDNYIYGKLLFYIIQTDAVLEAANQSEGTKMPRADWKKVKEVKISIPPKPEQERIAAILSDMDSEIEQLETQLAKYRQLKTGMMQELLTGKKRLV